MGPYHHDRMECIPGLSISPRPSHKISQKALCHVAAGQHGSGGAEPGTWKVSIVSSQIETHC